MRKRSEATQTLRSGCSKADPQTNKQTQTQTHIWNSLPDNVASASTLQTFQHDLKTFLFRLSYPDIILSRPVVLAVMTIT